MKWVGDLLSVLLVRLSSTKGRRSEPAYKLLEMKRFLNREPSLRQQRNLLNLAADHFVTGEKGASYIRVRAKAHSEVAILCGCTQPRKWGGPSIAIAGEGVAAAA